MSEKTTQQRLRIHYHKTQPLRYTGTLDIHKIWERTLRRAKLPLAYSQGFHPQPRINQALPLPLGLTSLAELMEIWLENHHPTEEILQSLHPVLHPGLTVQSITEITSNSPKLQNMVISAEYRVDFLDNIPDLEQRIAEILAAATLFRERRKKTYDLRPLIEALTILEPSSSEFQRLSVRLSSRTGATGRADEVIRALGIEPHNTRIERSYLHFLPYD